MCANSDPRMHMNSFSWSEQINEVVLNFTMLSSVFMSIYTLNIPLSLMEIRLKLHKVIMQNLNQK